jgi:O-methyltransferase
VNVPTWTQNGTGPRTEHQQRRLLLGLRHPDEDGYPPPGPLKPRCIGDRNKAASRPASRVRHRATATRRFPPCCGTGWRAARDRIRVGGLWLCDNTIWSVQVATATKREGQAGVTAFIREHNRLVADDPRYVGSIVPIRDGLMTALRIE